MVSRTNAPSSAASLCKQGRPLPDDLSWAVGAYDGGIDVVLRNEDEAAALAQRLVQWLPPVGWPGLGGWRRLATQR